MKPEVSQRSSEDGPNRCGFSAVVLAAGESRRFGSPKQVALFEQETLLDRAIRTVNESGAISVVVVLGAHAERIQQSCKLDGCRVVINTEWALGMSSSIRCGIAALSEATGAILMTCDMPNLRPSHLRLLAADDEITASRYPDGSLGVPAYFPASTFSKLRCLEGKRGAQDLLRGKKSYPLALSCTDIDTPEDLRSAQHLSLNP